MDDIYRGVMFFCCKDSLLFRGEKLSKMGKFAKFLHFTLHEFTYISRMSQIKLFCEYKLWRQLPPANW